MKVTRARVPTERGPAGPMTPPALDVAIIGSGRAGGEAGRVVYPDHADARHAASERDSLSHREKGDLDLAGAP